MDSLERQAVHTGITILAVVLCTTGAAYLTRAGGPLCLVIFMVGTVGGTANNFRRVQKMTVGSIAKADLTTRRLITIQIYTSPILGGVFAFALYLIFMAGFLEGTFFPKFKSANDPYVSFATFAALTEPATHADVAKAVLWAFIAGFSERLVPNFIDKIAKEAAADSPSQDAA
ncbi:MAG: hypothetical protein ACYS91_02435 [Planctomycetota bacterium]